MSLETEAIKPHIGSIIRADRAALCEDDATAQACLDLLEQRGVLVFPGINMSDAQQLAFTDRLGDRVNYTSTASGSDADAQDVYTISLDPAVNKEPFYVLGTFFWHMDGVTSDIPPPRATILSGRRISARGGQTEFANTYAAYAGLPDWEKAEVADLRVIHSAYASTRLVMEEEGNDEFFSRARRYVKEHPLVWTHASGRKSLLLGSHADRVKDMPLAHGRSLLARLLEWTAQPDYYYRHEWQEGDLVIWDNCGTVHRVVPYDETSGRTMHRTTIAGTELVS